MSIRRFGSFLQQGNCGVTFGVSRLNLYQLPNLAFANTCSHHALVHFSSSKGELPTVTEEDLEETFVKGSGPGGQCVNKLNNCVFLRHIPTGVFVKCHETRQLEKNRKLARQRLREKLDRHLHGEDCLAEKQKRSESVGRLQNKDRTRKKLEKLKDFKQREGISEK